MFSKAKNIASRFNWKTWTAALTTSTILTQSTLALCDNHNINNNHLTQFLNKEIGPDEFIPQNNEQKANYHLKKFQKPANSFLEWGMHIKSKNPSNNKYFENISIKTIKFSSNVQIALDTNGNMYCKYNNDEWDQIKGIRNIQDIAITNDTLFIINSSGQLMQLQYHLLPNKYDDPCIEKHLNISEEMERNMKNCIDHRRKRSFSSMPISRYQRYLQDEYQWTTTKEFSLWLTNQYNNNKFNINNVITEKLTKVYANDYRQFVLSASGNVYVRGDNQRGACGIGDDQSDISLLGLDTHLYIGSFVQIPSKYFDSEIIQMAQGEDHTLFLSSTGRIFSCGADNLMQLGLGWTKRKCILSDTNWNIMGQKGFEYTAKAFDNLDIGDIDDIKEYFHEVPSYDEFYPRVICGPYFDSYKVIDISAGDYHCGCIIEPLYISHNPLKKYHRELDTMTSSEILELKNELIANRRVITWGCGLHGQLGHRNFANCCEPQPVKTLENYKEYNKDINDIVKIKPIDIKCGKEHTIVLMEGYSSDNASKMIFAFGNNRYNQVSKKKSVKQGNPYWIQSILPQKCSIDNIAAGNFQSAAFGRTDNMEYQWQ